MQVLSITYIFFGVACTVFAKPYEYSYYLSLPGHYQSLAVKDGAVLINSGPPLLASSNIGLVNPSFRQERFGPGLNQNPQFGRRYPVSQNGPDFSRGRQDPNNLDIPDGELDPLFNQVDRFPQNQGRAFPPAQNGGPNFRGFDPRFNQIGPISPQQGRPDYREDNYNFDRRYNGANNPEFGTRLQPLISQHTGISRRASQEIDESDKAEREEVTTQQPCSFCGVDRVNPMDGINGNNTDPDSEPVEPKNVGGSNNPNFVVQNNVVTPASVVIPGYTPLVPYYVVL